MSKIPGVKRLLCFGDSLTEGWYHTGFAFHPYTIRLNELFAQEAKTCASSSGIELMNKGISGEVVNSEMMNRLPTILENQGIFDFAIILGGTNDLASLQAAKDYDLAKSIKSLHQMAHAKGIKTCAVTIPQTGFDMLPYAVDYVKYREDVNNEIRDFASKNPTLVCLCDLSLKLPRYGLSKNEFAEYWDDELHFTPKGYDRMAELIFEDIKNFI